MYDYTKIKNSILYILDACFVLLVEFGHGVSLKNEIKRDTLYGPPVSEKTAGWYWCQKGMTCIKRIHQFYCEWRQKVVWAVNTLGTTDLWKSAKVLNILN